jgi:hypothetical protein
MTRCYTTSWDLTLAEGWAPLRLIAHPTERGQCHTNCANDCPFGADWLSD